MPLHEQLECLGFFIFVLCVPYCSVATGGPVHKLFFFFPTMPSYCDCWSRTPRTQSRWVYASFPWRTFHRAHNKAWFLKRPPCIYSLWTRSRHTLRKFPPHQIQGFFVLFLFFCHVSSGPNSGSTFFVWSHAEKARGVGETVGLFLLPHASVWTHLPLSTYALPCTFCFISVVTDILSMLLKMNQVSGPQHFTLCKAK